MNNFKSITVNTLAQGLAKFIALVCAFSATVLLRRWWGRDGFGDYIFIFSLVTLLVSLADFGTHLVGVKMACQNPKIQAKILGNILDLRLLFSFGFSVSILLLLFVFFKTNPLFYALILVLPLFFLLLLKNSSLVFFHARQKLYLSSFQDILIALVIFLVTIILVWQKGSLVRYLVYTCLVYLLISVPFMVKAWSQVKPKLKPDWKLLKVLFKQSLPLGLILSLFTIYSKIDTIILKFFQGSTQVGIYGLSYKIYENLTLPAAFFANALLPIISQKIIHKKTRVSFILTRAADLLLLAALAIIFFTWILSPYFLQLLVGSKFSEETEVLKILSFSLPFVFLNHLLGFTIIAAGQQKKSLLISTLALIFNLGANLVLIPLYSFWAAGWITVLTEALVMFLSYRVIVQVGLGFPLVKSLPETVKFVFARKGEIFK